MCIDVPGDIGLVVGVPHGCKYGARSAAATTIPVSVNAQQQGTGFCTSQLRTANKYQTLQVSAKVANKDF